MEESGFIPSKDLRNLFPIVNFLFLFTFIYAGVKVFSLESLKINGNYSLFASLVILLNTLAILVTSNGLEGFGVRFFIPAILISLPLYSLIFAGEYRGVKIAWLNEKFRYFLLFLHFSIYVISYGRGYLNFNSGLYTFEATPGIKQIVAVLKENQVQYCATDYWISNPIIYETNFAILASTVRNLTSGPIRNPEIENVIINNPKGIQCIINNWFSPISNNSKKPNEFIENGFYSFRILKTLEVERNKIFIVEQLIK